MYERCGSVNEFYKTVELMLSSFYLASVLTRNDARRIRCRKDQTKLV